MTLKASTPSELSHDFESFRKTPARTPYHNLQTLSSVEVLRLYTHPQQQSLNASLKFETLRLLLGLHTPCKAPMPGCTSTRIRTKAISPEISKTNL
jgi:hypothetical protein